MATNGQTGNKKPSNGGGAGFACDLCDEFETAHAKSLYRHKEVMHSNIRYVCDWYDCQFETPRKDALKPHREAVHEGIRYPCAHCQHISKYKGGYLQHQKDKHGGGKGGNGGNGGGGGSAAEKEEKKKG